VNKGNDDPDIEIGSDGKYKAGTWSVEYDRLGALALEAVEKLKALFNADHGMLLKLKADNDSLRAANDNEAAPIKSLTARLDALENARR
jgi:hypothetical protein